METFQRLWVLDVSHTDWELDFPLETKVDPIVATDVIREVHVNKGRIWRQNLAWRRLPNLRKLRVVEPTMSWWRWEEGREDEFKDMVNLELLDLSGNSTIQVLPSLSGASNLKTLVLDGCVGLGHVGPQGLPPSLESFCFDSRLGKAKLSRISLAGCARLADFRLHGSLPNLEELDLSRTAVKMLDLKDEAAVQRLQKVFLVGCEQLRSISWPYNAERYIAPRLLCIDNRAGGEVARKASSYDSSMVCQGKGEYSCYFFVAVTDLRFLGSIYTLINHLWVHVTPKFLKVNLCWSSTNKDDGRSCHKKKMGEQVPAGSPLPRSSLTYHDVNTAHHTTTQIDGSTSATAPFQPLVDFHMEIGEGVSDVPKTVSEKGRRAIYYMMSDKVKSLHVHDNSSITNVTPEHIFQSARNASGVMNELKWCRVERCPKLQKTVFTTKYDGLNFRRLETFWAAHLLMSSSIWHTSPRTASRSHLAFRSFESLRAIHLHFCTRLIYVLRLSCNDDLSQLETLHILCCGDLKQVFAVEQEFQEDEESWLEWKPRNGMLQFTKLKDLYLQDLSSLQLICEAKMFAPNLETIYIRGCWGLRRLPATDARRRVPVAVNCEKDWWDKLEWDGMESGHHPSLFQPRHSKYYKKRHLRSTVLR
ncbi:unnamed protein product [Urochloa humidicola]